MEELLDLVELEQEQVQVQVPGLAAEGLMAKQVLWMEELDLQLMLLQQHYYFE